MFNRFFKRNPSGKPTGPVGRFYASSHGSQRGIPSIPLLVCGHGADGTAKMIAEGSSISCLAVEGLDDLARVLDGRPLVGLLAMSPREAPGEAGKAIALFQERYPTTITLYQPWSYNVERTAKRAIAYGAHGIVMPGVDVREMLIYIIQIGQRTDNGAPAPTTVEEHTQLLREFTPNSPFWMVQDKPDGPSY